MKSNSFSRKSKPSDPYMKHVREQAVTISQLMSVEFGIRHIKESLIDFPHLIAEEVERLNKNLKK